MESKKIKMSQDADDLKETLNDVDDGDSSLNTLTEEDIQKLISSSKEAMKYAYCEYSNFRVGAALLAEDGSIFTGCNIENVSYSLTTCAERTAIFKAVSEGHRKFKAIAISSEVKDSFTYPCGACRQVMIEFGQYDVYVSRPDSAWQHTTTQELIPHFFSKKALRSVQKAKIQN
ncbi:unnamed protein product [Candidula unifasciata]|uniref:Cytidine deaminase n=1 Tax=Candidula unifasciata TaxID=100452 RepID=A0A8S3Z300_9EUPU|nr:unnamed protein product [Candidula unifasciata]